MRFGATVAIVMAAAGALPALAQPGGGLPDQQGYITYHECMMLAAMKASRTDVSDTDVFAVAKGACAGTRAAVTAGQRRNAAFLAALDQADADEAADFPEWIHGVRARGEAGTR